MSGGPDDSPVPNGADTTPKSLREIASESWDEVTADADWDDDGADDTQPSEYSRDAQGRFAPKEASPGEQSTDPAQGEQAPPTEPQHPAPQGSSNEAPQHWRAEDRAMFARLPQEGRDFLLERHGAMERDYQSKVQAAASAVEFTNALAPVFQNPAVQQSLVDYSTGQRVAPQDAIQQWAAFHLRAMHPDLNVRAGLLRDLAQRMAISDPAAVFGPQQTASPPVNLPPDVQQNPVFRYLADNLGSAMNDVRTLRTELETLRSSGERQRQDDVLRATRQSIDQFADETDAAGNRIRPFFDRVSQEIMMLVHANPQIDMRQAYETACYMNPEVRNYLMGAQQRGQQSQTDLRRAQNAARSNVRGMTTPVSRPHADDGPRGMRQALADAAEEVGFEG